MFHLSVQTFRCSPAFLRLFVHAEGGTAQFCSTALWAVNWAVTGALASATGYGGTCRRNKHVRSKCSVLKRIRAHSAKQFPAFFVRERIHKLRIQVIERELCELCFSFHKSSFFIFFAGDYGSSACRVCGFPVRSPRGRPVRTSKYPPLKWGLLLYALKGMHTDGVLKHHTRLPTARKQAFYYLFGLSFFPLFDFNHFSNES